MNFSLVAKLLAVSVPAHAFFHSYHTHHDGAGGSLMHPYSPMMNVEFNLPPHKDAESKERHYHLYNDGVHFHDGHHHEAPSFMGMGSPFGAVSHGAYSPFNPFASANMFASNPILGMIPGLNTLGGGMFNMWGDNPIRTAKNETLPNYGGPVASTPAPAHQAGHSGFAQFGHALSGFQQFGQQPHFGFGSHGF